MTLAYPNLGELFVGVDASASQMDADGFIYHSEKLINSNYHIFAATGPHGHLHVEVTVGGGVWVLAAVTLIGDTSPDHITTIIPAGQIGFIRGRFQYLRWDSIRTVPKS